MLNQFISMLFMYFIDSLGNHLILYFFLFALADTKIRWKSMGKILLFIIPMTSIASYIFFAQMTLDVLVSYALSSVFTIIINLIFIHFVLKWSLLKAFSAICLAASMQVGAVAMLSAVISGITMAVLPGVIKYIFWVNLLYPIIILGFCMGLIKLNFGKHLRYLLNDRKSLPFTAAVTFLLEVCVEMLFTMKDML